MCSLTLLSRLCFFLRKCNKRLTEKGSKVKAFAVHPGVVRTEVTRHMNYFMRLGNAIFGPVLAAMSKTPEEGAYSSVFAATSPALDTARGGDLYFHCKVFPVSRAAQDAKAAARLWDVSAELTGL
jgi:retinol dehydrogenase 12